MEFSRSIKAFFGMGLLLILLGFGMTLKEIGDITGYLVMISGVSFVIGTFITITSEWIMGIKF